MVYNDLVHPIRNVETKQSEDKELLEQHNYYITFGTYRFYYCILVFENQVYYVV